MWLIGYNKDSKLVDAQYNTLGQALNNADKRREQMRELRLGTAHTWLLYNLNWGFHGNNGVCGFRGRL